MVARGERGSRATSRVGRRALYLARFAHDPSKT